MSKRLLAIMKKYVCVTITLTILVIQASHCIAEGCNITRKQRSDERIYPDGSTKQRYPRLITFNTQDDGDVTVDLEFAVPFITIPVKRTMDNIWGLSPLNAKANINVGAIVLTGAMVFGAAVVIPMISTFFQRTLVLGGKQRSSETTDTWHLTQLLDKALAENNIDAISCMQRTVCWLTKSSSNKFKTGQAVSQDMIINGLATNSWLNNMMDGTAIHAAIVAGLANVNCSAKYKDCKITQKSIQGLVNRFGSLFRFK